MLVGVNALAWIAAIGGGAATVGTWLGPARARFAPRPCATARAAARTSYTRARARRGMALVARPA
jgi:hypothetical protein